MSNDLVGRCGLYCGACGIYRSQRDDPALRQRLADQFHCPVEAVRCNGCGHLEPDDWGWNCRLVQCQKEKGGSSCYFCPQYRDDSCISFQQLAADYRNEEEGEDLRWNLEQIHNDRGGAWLTWADQAYRCPSCGLPRMAGARTCCHCHSPLEQVSHPETLKPDPSAPPE